MPSGENGRETEFCRQFLLKKGVRVAPPPPPKKVKSKKNIKFSKTEKISKKTKKLSKKNWLTRNGFFQIFFFSPKKFFFFSNFPKIIFFVRHAKFDYRKLKKDRNFLSEIIFRCQGCRVWKNIVLYGKLNCSISRIELCRGQVRFHPARPWEHDHKIILRTQNLENFIFVTNLTPSWLESYFGGKFVVKWKC